MDDEHLERMIKKQYDKRIRELEQLDQIMRYMDAERHEKWKHSPSGIRTSSQVSALIEAERENPNLMNELIEGYKNLSGSKYLKNRKKSISNPKNKRTSCACKKK